MSFRKKKGDDQSEQVKNYIHFSHLYCSDFDSTGLCEYAIDSKIC